MKEPGRARALAERHRALVFPELRLPTQDDIDYAREIAARCKLDQPAAPVGAPQDAVPPDTG